MIRKEKCIIRRLVITSPGKLSFNMILEKQNKYNQQKESMLLWSL